MRKNKMVVYIAIFLCLSMCSSNVIWVNAATISELDKVVTVSGNAQTNETTTVTGYAPLLYAGVGIDVATVEDYKAQLNTAISNNVASITLNYTGSTAFTGFPSSLGSIITDVMQTAGNDYEKLLLKSWQYTYTTPVSNAFSVTYTFVYWQTVDQTTQVKDKVDSIIASIITPGMTDEQKEKAINDYICLNVGYDTTLKEHSAYAALFGNKKTVCQGYALLAYKMLIAAGLNARIVTGTANNSGHAWNMVEIKDASGQNPKWYDLDVTWNDPVPDVVGRIRYDYFNLSDSQLLAKAHKWTASYYPVATSAYVTTDPEITAGGRTVDIITAAPASSTVAIVNNVETSDVVNVTGLAVGDVVKVYKDNTTETAVGMATVAALKSSVSIKIPQIGKDSGEVYVSVKNKGAFESTRTPVTYSAEPISDMPNIAVTNNVDKADIVTVSGVKAKDLVTIYAKDSTVTPIGKITATKDGTVTITLAKQLKEADGLIQATLKSVNKLVSSLATVTFDKQAVTSTITPGSITVKNNVDIADIVEVKGMTPKDVVTIYAADGTTTIGKATIGSSGKATIIVSVPTTTPAGKVTKVKQLDEANRNVVVTVKNYNKEASAKATVTVKAQEVTDTPVGVNTTTPGTGTPATKTVGETTVTNNVDKGDAVTVKGLAKGDVVTLYSDDTATNTIGTIKASKAGTVTININNKKITDKNLAKQLDEINRSIFLTVKNYNRMASQLVELDYDKQEVTTPLDTNKMFVTNNAILISGLTAGDKVSVYESEANAIAVSKTPKPVAVATVIKGNTYAILSFRTLTLGTTKLYITNKSINKEKVAAVIAVTLP